MQVAGIVAEYNPFHTGHAYQIARTRSALDEDCAVVAVMSGNWVQQADCAIADKWLRTRLALLGGADLVLELPTVWATSSAEGFARGAVSILNASGVVDYLSFGSECGDIGLLRQSAAHLDTTVFSDKLKYFMGLGTSFPAARQQALAALIGPDAAAPLSSPNNTLGIEYIRALNALNSSIQPMTVRRQGSAHNAVACVTSDGHTAPSALSMPQFVSATQIRMDIADGNWDRTEPYLVTGGRKLLEENIIGLPGLELVSRAMLARVRTMTAADWAALPDSGASEGLPQRLERAGKQCTSLEEFFQLAGTKRYTRSRTRRLLLRAYLGITANDIPATPPYIRVLGFNARGRALLKDMKKRSALPILTKPAHARELDEPGRTLFRLEARCTDLYDLCFEIIPVPGREWTANPIIME